MQECTLDINKIFKEPLHLPWIAESANIYPEFNLSTAQCQTTGAASGNTNSYCASKYPYSMMWLNIKYTGVQINRLLALQ